MIIMKMGTLIKTFRYPMLRTIFLSPSISPLALKELGAAIELIANWANVTRAATLKASL